MSLIDDNAKSHYSTALSSLSSLLLQTVMGSSGGSSSLYSSSVAGSTLGSSSRFVLGRWHDSFEVGARQQLYQQQQRRFEDEASLLSPMTASSSSSSPQIGFPNFPQRNANFLIWEYSCSFGSINDNSAEAAHMVIWEMYILYSYIKKYYYCQSSDDMTYGWTCLQVTFHIASLATERILFGLG